MKIRFRTLQYFLVFFHFLCIKALRKGDLCPDGHSRCLSLKQCPSALLNISSGHFPILCAVEHSEFIVCCSELGGRKNDIANDTLIFKSRKLQSVAERMCNNYIKSACNGTLIHSTLPTVVGGVSSNPKQFPHMALIGYGSYQKVSWLCGASLISERYVLSAAHCSVSHLGKARWVRLGELDLDSQKEDADPRDYEIIYQILHPEYNPDSMYNDIALFKLNKNVNFNDYVRPVCLYTLMNLPKEKLNTLIATGWGATGYGEVGSSVMMYVTLNFIDYSKCKNVYKPAKDLIHGIDENTMICAGYLAGGKDTCLGDSGGPLQFLNIEAGCPLIYYQVGIVSFGKSCALKDSAGVYTKVAPYIPWIESVVWK